jgi:CRISPR-associated exonuclease Cas4
MPRESQYSKITDVEEEYLTATDVKQYVFCPLVTYFTRVMRLRPIMGSQQEEAKKTHKKTAELEQRRESLLKVNLPFKVQQKLFDVAVVSERLCAHGRLDMLVITEQGERIPVEFKAMQSQRGQAHSDHKYQLVVLSLFVEDAFKTIVRRGFVYYLKDNISVQLILTHGLKRRAETILKSIKVMVDSGAIPSGRPQCSRTTIGCGFADFCRNLS